ncbi:hypothetical protein DK324_13080 [Listeria monocytogenes]|nr:hypothetical protein [Listeria monocytogenes]EAG9433871.1 hypothetical protein [Listeria monocytogenes]PWR35928.1 hypothetical protein DK324_13080 [Listeria monocytogenes]
MGEVKLLFATLEVEIGLLGVGIFSVLRYDCREVDLLRSNVVLHHFYTKGEHQDEQKVDRYYFSKCIIFIGRLR